MANLVRGVAPGFILVPAREYQWEPVRKVQVKLPNKGQINELLTEEERQKGITIPGDATFSVFEGGLLQLWEIVRVLFAQAHYPDLKDNECLNVVALEFNDNEITLYGELLRYV